MCIASCIYILHLSFNALGVLDSSFSTHHTEQKNDDNCVPYQPSILKYNNEIVERESRILSYIVVILYKYITLNVVTLTTELTPIL